MRSRDSVRQHREMLTEVGQKTLSPTPLLSVFSSLNAFLFIFSFAATWLVNRVTLSQKISNLHLPLWPTFGCSTEGQTAAGNISI